LDLTGVELSILLVDDVEMRSLNHAWRGLDRTTDVLSFATRDAQPMVSGAETESLGDLVISLPMAERQAKRFKHSLETELGRLAVHGILHLIGHDHVKGGSQAERMRLEERRLMRRLSIATPPRRSRLEPAQKTRR